MRERMELRGGLAVGRALVAAGAAAVMLSSPGARAAAPPPVAWTKTWAERQLRLHFDATTVACLPLGSATHANGSNSFKEFVCGLVLADGTRLSIHLKPRSRTTWTTLSMKRLGPSPETKHGGGGGSPAPDAAHGQGNEQNA
jgi:hypothetical protein